MSTRKRGAAASGVAAGQHVREREDGVGVDRDVGVDVRPRQRACVPIAGVQRGDLRRLGHLDDGHARVDGCRDARRVVGAPVGDDDELDGPIGVAGDDALEHRSDDARLVVGRDHDADARHDPTAMVRTGTCAGGSSGASCAAAAVGASTSSQAPTASSMQNSRKVCMNPNAS